ncbi:MAG: nucleotidyl transferase AbiEii/AbiGii toxin family protein [bacterium]|nr:nucleotidyl transferase AbiEii/AbiGii toxin family protein [bacterium]
MSTDEANIAQSVRQRLLNLARNTDQDYNRILVRYSLERLLYRMSISDFSDRFILKGAMLFAVWSDQQYRATQDLDLLGIGSNSPQQVADTFGHIAAAVPQVPDGMAYDSDTITAGLIREDMKYEGVRIRMDSRLDNARIPLFIDVGFGDSIIPPPTFGQYPVLLDSPAPVLRMYRRETAIAEKLHAMTERGVLNSRMKDFADIWYLSQHFDFDGQTLSDAIASTFARRELAVPASPIAFGTDFAQRDDKQAQWKAFIRRSCPEGLPIQFGQVVEGIATFGAPVLSHLAASGPMPRCWQAPGPWRF